MLSVFFLFLNSLKNTQKQSPSKTSTMYAGLITSENDEIRRRGRNSKCFVSLFFLFASACIVFCMLVGTKANGKEACRGPRNDD